MRSDASLLVAALESPVVLNSKEKAAEIAERIIPPNWYPTEDNAFANSIVANLEPVLIDTKFIPPTKKLLNLKSDEEAKRFLIADIKNPEQFLARVEVQSLLNDYAKKTYRGMLAMSGFDPNSNDLDNKTMLFSTKYPISQWKKEIYEPALIRAQKNEWSNRMSSIPGDYLYGHRCFEAGRSGHILSQLPLVGIFFSMMGMLYHGSKFLSLLLCMAWPNAYSKKIAYLSVSTWVWIVFACCLALILFSAPQASINQPIVTALVQNVNIPVLRTLIKVPLTWQSFYWDSFTRQHQAVCEFDNTTNSCLSFYEKNIKKYAQFTKPEEKSKLQVFQESLEKNKDYLWLKNNFPKVNEDQKVVEAQKVLVLGTFCK